MNPQLALIPTPEQMIVVKGLAEHFVKSGLFKDTSDVSKAIVKIMLGHSIGIGPVESMMGVNIIQGRIALAANLIASKVKSGGKYDYRVVEQSDQECVIHFFQKGEFIGQAGFTMDEARKAGLATKAVWQQYPSDMLFARAISRGARRFCPDAFGTTAVYTAEELGAEVDPETGQVLTAPSAPSLPLPTDAYDGEFVDDVPTTEGETPATTNGSVPYKPSRTAKLDELNTLGEKAYGTDWPAMRETFTGEETKGKVNDPSKVFPVSIERIIARVKADIESRQPSEVVSQ